MSGRRTLLIATCLATPLLLGLGGCAALNTMQADIATYGDWPADRQPGRYAFDRLPSQQSRPDAAAALEDAARPALEQAGFVAAGPGEAPDVLVQVAARNARTDIDLWADPIWWHGGWRPGRRAWVDPLWWPQLHARTRYEREVGVLLRDAATGKPLYEARASNEGANVAGSALQQALFRAALIDFPRVGPNPRTVTVTLP